MVEHFFVLAVELGSLGTAWALAGASTGVRAAAKTATTELRAVIPS